MVGDIGSHWLDLSSFMTGLRVVERDARTWRRSCRCVSSRSAQVETFAAAGDVERVDAPMTTEDCANVLVRFEGGARGS